MPIFRPFKGVRPLDEHIETFPTMLSVDELPRKEVTQNAKLDNSYIRMIKPYLNNTSKYINRNLSRVRSNFEELLERNVLTQDHSSYYLYEQIFPDKTIYRGLLGLVSIEDFWNGKIKKHESTLPERKEKMSLYLEKVNVQAEPVLLTYPTNPKVELFMNIEEKNIPIYNYTSENGTRHKVWKIDNRLKITQIKEVLEQMDAFYIADGHHRMGAASIYARKKLSRTKRVPSTDGSQSVFAYLVSKESIKIHDYNRLIKDLNGLSKKEFFQKLEASFLIHEKGETPYYPSKKFHFSMYIDGQFYSLHLKHDIRKEEHLKHEDFDHLLLQKYILKDILNIENPKTTDKVAYAQGSSNIDSILNLKKEVDSGEYRLAIGIYPVSFKDLMEISDQKIIMPPKCTLIEPKLVRGLVMYDLKS